MSEDFLPIRPLALTVASVVLLAACAMERTPVTASFSAGYADGCGSGQRDADLPGISARDEARARADADYAKGWNQGYTICFTQVMDRRRPRRDDDDD